MACNYSDFDGLCGLYDKNIDEELCVQDGFCICEEDPEPLCPSFESDEDEDDWI